MDRHLPQIDPALYYVPLGEPICKADFAAYGACVRRAGHVEPDHRDANGYGWTVDLLDGHPHAHTLRSAADTLNDVREGGAEIIGLGGNVVGVQAFRSTPGGTRAEVLVTSEDGTARVTVCALPPLGCGPDAFRKWEDEHDHADQDLLNTCHWTQIPDTLDDLLADLDHAVARHTSSDDPHGAHPCPVCPGHLATA